MPPLPLRVRARRYLADTRLQLHHGFERTVLPKAERFLDDSFVGAIKLANNARARFVQDVDRSGLGDKVRKVLGEQINRYANEESREKFEQAAKAARNFQENTKKTARENLGPAFSAASERAQRAEQEFLNQSGPQCMSFRGDKYNHHKGVNPFRGGAAAEAAGSTPEVNNIAFARFVGPRWNKSIITRHLAAQLLHTTRDVWYMGRFVSFSVVSKNRSWQISTIPFPRRWRLIEGVCADLWLLFL